MNNVDSCPNLSNKMRMQQLNDKEILKVYQLLNTSI